MCTAYSHYIYSEGNCLCGAYKNGSYDESRAILKRTGLGLSDTIFGKREDIEKTDEV